MPEAWAAGAWPSCHPSSLLRITEAPGAGVTACELPSPSCLFGVTRDGRRGPERARGRRVTAPGGRACCHKEPAGAQHFPLWLCLHCARARPLSGPCHDLEKHTHGHTHTDTHRCTYIQIHILHTNKHTHRYTRMCLHTRYAHIQICIQCTDRHIHINMHTDMHTYLPWWLRR